MKVFACPECGFELEKDSAEIIDELPDSIVVEEWWFCPNCEEWVKVESYYSLDHRAREFFKKF